MPFFDTYSNEDETLSTTYTSDSRISDTLIRQITRIRLNPDTGALVSFPEPNSSTEVDQWLEYIESLLVDGNIPRAEWPDAAILFLEKDSDMNKAIRSLKDHRVQQRFDTWTWEEFSDVVRKILVERDARGTFSFAKLRNEHPVATVAAGSIFVAAISPPLLVVALNVVGFGSSGVAAGSIAAGAQSALYGGATAGLFAACQSAGAAGLGATATAVTSMVGGATARLALLGRRKRKDDEDTVTQSEDEVVYSFDPEPSTPSPYDE